MRWGESQSATLQHFACFVNPNGQRSPVIPKSPDFARRRMSHPVPSVGTCGRGSRPSSQRIGTAPSPPISTTRSELLMGIGAGPITDQHRLCFRHDSTSRQRQLPSNITTGPAAERHHSHFSGRPACPPRQAISSLSPQDHDAPQPGPCPRDSRGQVVTPVSCRLYYVRLGTPQSLVNIVVFIGMAFSVAMLCLAVRAVHHHLRISILMIWTWRWTDLKVE
jgi:hypothetical protein